MLTDHAAASRKPMFHECPVELRTRNGPDLKVPLQLVNFSPVKSMGEDAV